MDVGLASGDLGGPQKPKARHDYLQLPMYYLNPTCFSSLEWASVKIEYVLYLFLASESPCRHVFLSMVELKDSGNFKPALWSLVLILAAAQAVARGDKLYLLFWGDSLFEDFCAAVITGLALGYSLTMEFLLASFLFGFSFFKTVLLICSRVRNPERELPTIMPRWRRFHQVAIRWAGSVMCVPLGAITVPWWSLFIGGGIGPMPCCGFYFVAGLSLSFVAPFVGAWFIFVSNVFSLRQFHLMTQEGCCSNVRRRLLVLLQSHGVSTEELFLDVVAEGNAGLVDIILEHDAAQVDSQGSLALHMACNPNSRECAVRRHNARMSRASPIADRRSLDAEAMAPMVRCLMNHGATPPPGCAVGSLCLGTVSCLVEYGHREALHPHTFANAVLAGLGSMIQYLMQQGVDVDVGIREACALRGPHDTIRNGLFYVLRNIPATAPLPFTEATVEHIRQGDPEATAVLLLHANPKFMFIEAAECESIAVACVNNGQASLAIDMLARGLISVESDAAEYALRTDVQLRADSVTTLMARLGSVQFPKRALDRALGDLLNGVRVPLSWRYRSATNLLQLGATLPAGYEEETARSGDRGRCEFLQEAILIMLDATSTSLTKAAR